jgi:hypothetical protein
MPQSLILSSAPAEGFRRATGVILPCNAFIAGKLTDAYGSAIMAKQNPELLIQ